MSRILAFVTLLLGVALSSTGAVAAQTPSADVDVASVRKAVLAANPAALVAALGTPPGDAELPEGFVNPPSGTPESAGLGDVFAFSLGEDETAVGSVNHAFQTDSSVVPGLVSQGFLTYIVQDAEITEDALAAFEELARQNVDTGDDATEASVQRVGMGGTQTVQISVVTEVSGISATVQFVAIPVGNTMVISMVLSANQSALDPAELLPFAEALALAGVQHLGTVAATGA